MVVELQVKSERAGLVVQEEALPLQLGRRDVHRPVVGEESLRWCCMFLRQPLKKEQKESC